MTGTDFTLSKLNSDYFGRREPTVKTHIDKDEFTAIKRFTIKTATSRFNIDLASNKSVSLFEDAQHPDSLPDPREQGYMDTPDIGISKEFSESKFMEHDRVEDFMKTASQFGVNQGDKKEERDDLEVEHGIN